MSNSLTNKLKSEYIKKGYKLSDDEDFVYLTIPNEVMPVIFYSPATTIEKIEEVIKHKETSNVKNV